jgi:hypothetical protein
MKPAWDSLMEEYEGHKSILIGDVDCTADGKALCDSVGVSGYPTIKQGDPGNLEDYQGGRDLASLQKFAAELKPLCSPSNMDLCDEESKAALEKVMALSAEEIDAQIEAGDAKIKDAETTFSTELEKLQASYQELMKTRDDTIAEVKASGLGQLKSVKAYKAANPAAGHDEL